MVAQPQLFTREQAPRRRRRVMMHVTDAGLSGCFGVSSIIKFRCERCGHDTGWIAARTVTEDRRGRPCPNCNEEGE